MPEAMPPNVHPSTHPPVAHKPSLLRDRTTEPKKFRELVRELSWLLGYEAMADPDTEAYRLETPIEAMDGTRLATAVGLVPVLRAGLGMVEAMLELMPMAEVWHIGLYRDERTLKPVEYYNKLPDAATVQACLILDPMLATGGSSAATVDLLKGSERSGSSRCRSLPPRRIATLTAAYPDVEIHVGAVDRQPNERGYIMPGLGDAGDRQPGTFPPASGAAAGDDRRGQRGPEVTASGPLMTHRHRWPFSGTPSRYSIIDRPTQPAYPRLSGRLLTIVHTESPLPGGTSGRIMVAP